MAVLMCVHTAIVEHSLGIIVAVLARQGLPQPEVAQGDVVRTGLSTALEQCPTSQVSETRLRTKCNVVRAHDCLGLAVELGANELRSLVADLAYVKMRCR